MARPFDPTVMCLQRYDRSHVDRRCVPLFCQYKANHLGNCSWQEIRNADDELLVRRSQAVIEDAEQSRRVVVIVDEEGGTSITGSAVVDALVLQIKDGEFDPYLEIMLNAAHNRKRALRGVRGFRFLRP